MRQNKGAISLFALVSMLFFLIFIMVAYSNISSKNKFQDETTEVLFNLYKATGSSQIYAGSLPTDTKKLNLLLKSANEKNTVTVDNKDNYIYLNNKIYLINDEYNTYQTLTGKPYSYDNPVIPEGFSISDDGAEWAWDEQNNCVVGWNDGLVIESETGDQFVWVPIDGTDVKYEKWCENLNGEEYSKSYNDCYDDTLPNGVSSENAQIEKYEGFYIGRFETGRSDIDKASASINNVATGITPLIQKAAQPWNYIDYFNAKAVSENYMSTDMVKSGLITRYSI